MAPRDILERLLRAADTDPPVAPTEADGLDLLEAYGIPVPMRVRVTDADGAPNIDVSRFPGDRVVVKVLSPAIAHKSDVGGIRVVARSADAVANAIEEMNTRLGDSGVTGWLVCEFVPHADTPGAQLLVSLRRTPDFGPLVCIGFGGIHAERLAATTREDRAIAVAPADDPILMRHAQLARAAVMPLATESQRGRAPLFVPGRLDLVLSGLACIARDDPTGRIRELEINPLAAGRDGPVALDALVRIDGPLPTDVAPRPLERIARLVRPESIAILGVSARGTNPGRIILRNILRAGFEAGRVAVVKQGLDSIDGVQCVADLASLPGGRVDLLIVAVDAAQVPAVVDEVCDERRAESMIVIPGGLGETPGSTSRVSRIAAALAASRTTAWGGPVVNGGNCLGIRSRAGRYDTLFIPEPKLPPPARHPSPLVVLSQSGAFGITTASRLGPAQPELLVTLGNQTDLTLGDWMEHVEGDRSLRVIACYAEGFRAGDGRRWLESARRCVDQGRTVVLYLAGRTRAGAGAAASHTASIAGDWETTRSLATGAGVLVPRDLETFHDLVRTFVLLADRIPRGTRLGAMSNAGFECVAIADESGSFRLATFDRATEHRIEAMLREYRLDGIVQVRNPLDVTPIVDDRGFAFAASAILNDPAVDVAVLGCVPLSGGLQTLPPGDGHAEDVRSDEAVAAGMLRAFQASDKPCVAVVDAGASYDAFADTLTSGGLPTFRSANRALRALAAFCAAARGGHS